MNVHLFVLLQNTVPLPIPMFVWCRLLRMFQYADSMGGKLSKREGVLFHWWSSSSKRNDELQLFYTDISLI